MLKLNAGAQQLSANIEYNLNTSYVEVKLDNTFVKVSVKTDLNTSYVEVKRKN